MVFFQYKEIILNCTNEPFRRVQNALVKCINETNNINFNKFFIENNLSPKYTNFKLYDEAAKSQQFVLEFNKELISLEIQINVVYPYSCPIDACKAIESSYMILIIYDYISYTTNTLKIRME
jgi:hypothetical protein